MKHWWYKLSVIGALIWTLSWAGCVVDPIPTPGSPDEASFQGADAGAESADVAPPGDVSPTDDESAQDGGGASNDASSEEG